MNPVILKGNVVLFRSAGVGPDIPKVLKDAGENNVLFETHMTPKDCYDMMAKGAAVFCFDDPAGHVFVVKIVEEEKA
jgi:hypothetical protein